MKAFVLIFAVLSALMPVITQRTGLSDRYGFKMKMLCAAMYLVTGVLSAVYFCEITAYSLMILSALCLGVLGDFFLSYKEDKYFPVGVVFFALGHIVYSLCFLYAGEYKASGYILSVTGITLVLTLSIILFAKARLKLRGKKMLLLAYAPVLIFAFACAFMSGVASVNAGNIFSGLCLISGGTLFLASDIMIGIGKGGIKRPKFMHNAVSYTYFTAQTLFALSIIFQ